MKGTYLKGMRKGGERTSKARRTRRQGEKEAEEEDEKNRKGKWRKR